MSLAYSSVYGNKIRKLWKLLAKNDMLTSTSYEFSNPNDCKVKDCNFKVISYHVVKNFYCYSMFVSLYNRPRLLWRLSDISGKTI